MMKRAGRLLVCILLIASMTVGVLAASPASMDDIRNHWARDAIYYVMVEGLFNGVSDTQFAPDAPMSRAMFVTVLGRLAGIDPADYETWYLDNLYTDVTSDAWYAPYVCWATLYGITNGVDGGRFAPNDPINREQMATMTVRFASIYNYAITASGETPADTFADWDSVSSYAQNAVENLRITGIMNGTLQDNGTYLFQPKEQASRAQCATLMSRLSRALIPYTDREVVEPISIILTAGDTDLLVSDYTNLTASITPAGATNQTLTWFSTDRSVVTVTNGVVTAVGAGEAEVYCYTYNGHAVHITITVSAPRSSQPMTPQPASEQEVQEAQSAGLAYYGESYADKCIRIFGEVVNDPRSYYTTSDTSYLVTVPVQVWDYTDQTYTTKYTKTINITVHKNIAATVQAIFEEIYNGPEQFPIYSAGGYYKSTASEHDPGLAIDINPNSNYYCDPNGKAITGTHWDPENDPYSIPLEGDVVQAFRKYGFTQGIYWRSGYKDYMHFSYFAT